MLTAYTVEINKCLIIPLTGTVEVTSQDDVGSTATPRRSD